MTGRIHRKKMRNIIIGLTLVMSVMLFISNPIDNSHRLYQGLWNTGHLFFFAFLSWLFITHTSLIERSWLRMLLVSLLFAVLLGGAIEVIQFIIGRYMEWQDLLTDVLGALLGFLMVQYSQPEERRPVNRPVIMSLSLVVLLAAFYPVISILRDDLKIEASFPVIANFESEDTLARWDNEFVGRFEINHQIYIEGNSSAYVEFELSDEYDEYYPGVALEVIYPDWSAYQYLNISIHNDQSAKMDIEVKVYDRLHRQTGYEYSDRFNREVGLAPGWNNLKINLHDVLNAPQDRRMNLDDIAGFSVFIFNPQTVISLHLDNIHLSN